MRNGIVAGTLDPALPFAAEITWAATQADFSPLLAYAIKWNETAALPDAATVVSADGGHGLMQLTSAFPPNWADPYANALYAIDNFLEPAETYWAAELQGEDLVRAIAAEYNAGRSAAIHAHAAGDIDAATTNNYAARALATYLRLCQGEPPE